MNQAIEFNTQSNRRFVMNCRHCHYGKVSRPRGLCWSCYYRPGIRDQYPSTSKFGRRGLGLFYGRVPLPSQPTAALPGSSEKVAVLEQRARLKQALWHPDDARGPIRKPILVPISKSR
jgi:hypothetical protein